MLTPEPDPEADQDLKSEGSEMMSPTPETTEDTCGQADSCRDIRKVAVCKKNGLSTTQVHSSTNVCIYSLSQSSQEHFLDTYIRTASLRLIWSNCLWYLSFVDIYISNWFFSIFPLDCHSCLLFPGLSGHPPANMGIHSGPYLYIAEVKRWSPGTNNAHMLFWIKTKPEIFV